MRALQSRCWDTLALNEQNKDEYIRVVDRNMFVTFMQEVEHVSIQSHMTFNYTSVT